MEKKPKTVKSIAEGNKITTINGKISYVHGLEDSIVKMSVPPIVTHRLNAISIKIPIAETKSNPKRYMETQKAPKSQNHLEKKNKEITNFLTSKHITKLQ